MALVIDQGKVIEVPVTTATSASSPAVTAITQGFAPAVPTLTNSPTAPIFSSSPSASSFAGLVATSGGTISTAVAATAQRVMTADPLSPVEGETWFRSDTLQFCAVLNGTTRRVTLT